jgi:alpha-methylacyl-CoA racemase
VVAALLGAAPAAGQAVDAAMVDGAALLTSHPRAARRRPLTDHREANLPTGGAVHAVYETADARHLAVGARAPVLAEPERVGPP